jgi:putative intracellular protease/amidase
MWKKIVLGLSILILSVVGFGFWFVSLIDKNRGSEQISQTLPKDLFYLRSAVTERRGKILAVVTSTSVMGTSGKPTGYELTELSRAYYVFEGNGFEVDIASPLGGKPPVIIDDDDMAEFDYAFLNDEIAQNKVNNSMPIDDVDPADYQAVYFVGGKGAMFDFPDNLAIQALVKHYYQSDKVVGAVCHGPAALVNVNLDDGTKLVANKRISGFTNEEELFLIADAAQIFPFLLEDKLAAQGAEFIAGPKYLQQISESHNLVTGQNPWSVWAVAEAMVRQLGYPTIVRKITADEHSVDVLGLYASSGYEHANRRLHTFLNERPAEINRNLILMHSIVAVMEFELLKAVNLLRLTVAIKDLQNKPS